MLQATEPLTTGPLMSESDAGQRSTRETVNWALGILRRQFLVIVLLTLLATSAGVIYVFTAPVTYTAEATIAIDPRRVQLFQGATFAESQVDSPSAFETQLELVKSAAVALSVVRDLRLTEAPDFVGEPGSQSEPGGVPGFVSHFFSLHKPSDALSEIKATRVAVRVLSRNLIVYRVGTSHFLSIRYRSLNPDRAAQIANAIAEAYIAEQLRSKYQSTKNATGWLQGQIEELNQKRALADRAVLDFKQKNNMIAADGKLINEQQVGELNSKLTDAHQKTFEIKANLDRIADVIRDGMLEAKSSATVTDTLNNPIITQLRTRYLEFANREAEWSQKYGANHLAVVNLRNRVRDLRGSILEELKRLRESYVSEYEIAKQRERDLEKSLSGAVAQSQKANQAQVGLRELESSAQTLRTTHDVFLQRHAESLQQQAFPVSEARIFSLASPPSDPSNRKAALILVIAAAGGLALGVAVGMFWEVMNRSLYTREQVESELQTACISIVPLAGGEDLARSNAKPMLPADQGLGDRFDSRRVIPRNPNLFWAGLDSPLSRFAEAMRSIKLAVDLNSSAVSSNKVIGFISSLPNEGKSTIASNVALLIAQAGARVILVDCDLRNPSLSRSLAPNADHGILDVIAGRLPLEEVIWTDRFTNLAFLPAAIKTRVMHSTDFLAADATKELFDVLRSRYDYVLVDLSPLMPVVDARATSVFVDCYICVVEWGRTKIDSVKYAFRDAQNISENVLGVVLNKADMDRLSSYYPIGENHYRNKYYAQYGITK
jgi:polysaccharide biosynthesis transport protein